ncbi:MAG: triose-phosphate isomerase [Bacilli bacterium]
MGNKIVIGNMKMNLTYNEICDYVTKINVDSKQLIICPSSIYIPYFIGHNYKVGIQNVFFKNSGAYTGEISSLQCKSLNIDYAIVGHSERRILFKEDDETINMKIKSVLANNMSVILCVGEHKNEDANQIIKKQLMLALEDISDIENVVIAYEPVWAIGTNEIPTNEVIYDTIKYIKELIYKKFNKNIKVLYGGSINEKNIELLMKISNCDGFLVGGASTKINEFLKIIEVALYG